MIPEDCMMWMIFPVSLSSFYNIFGRFYGVTATNQILTNEEMFPIYYKIGSQFCAKFLRIQRDKENDHFWH